MCNPYPELYALSNDIYLLMLLLLITDPFISHYF